MLDQSSLVRQELAMGKTKLKKFSIEDLVAYVTQHWTETQHQILNVMESHIRWGEATGNMDRAAGVCTVLDLYLTMLWPTTKRHLDNMLRLSKDPFSSDSEIRAEILKCLEESEKARRKAQEYVDSANP